MLIPKELIIEAKEKLGDEAALIIARDLNIKEFDEEKLKGLCPFHNEDSGSFIWNPKENSYKCFGCGKVYGILDHYIEYNRLTYLDAVEKLFKKLDIKFRFGEKGIKTEREYSYPHSEQTDNLDIIKEYWNKRKISEETLRYAGIGQDEHGNTVFHYYDTNDVLCNVKYRLSRKVEKHEKLPKFWSQKESDTMPLLYGMNRIDPTQPLVICEGESDYLSILESGYRNVTSVPFGAGYKKVTNIEKEMFTWIETNFDWLQLFSKIIIFFDNDTVGIKGRKEACARLGTWRSYFVDFPNEMEGEDEQIHKTKDANEILYWCGKQKVLDFINNAKEMPVPNVIDLSEAENFDIENSAGLYSSIDDVNKIIYKYVYGSVVILTGKKGHGKSSFLNQEFICNALDQDEDIFIFSGELNGPVLKSWIETAMLGPEHMEMKDGFVRKFDKDSVLKAREWYKSRIWSYDGLENDSETILDRAVDVTRKFGVKIWVIDNLMTVSLKSSGKSSQWEDQKDFLVKLIGLAKIYNILIVLVVHPRKRGGIEIDREMDIDDISGAGDIGNLAQYIVGIHKYGDREKNGVKDGRGNYKKGGEPVKEDVQVKIMKNRYTGFTKDTRLYFNYLSYRFWNKEKELYRRYKWDKNTEPIKKLVDNNSQPDFIKD